MSDRYAAERAITRSGLPAPSRLILFVLLTHVTNGTLTVPPEFAPSLKGLAEETGLSRGTVAEHLNCLESGGWLERRRPTTVKALKARARTGYRITVPAAFRTSPGAGPVQEPDPSESRTGPEEAQVTTSPGAGPVQEPDGTSPGAGHSPMSFPMSSSPSEKKTGGAGGKRRTRTDEHPAFAEWYAAYPVHKARGAAARAYAKAAKKTTPAVLLVAARSYRDDPQVARGYGKHPATWLNSECWLDEAAPLRATGTDGTAYGHGPRARVNDHDWSKGGPTV